MQRHPATLLALAAVCCLALLPLAGCGGDAAAKPPQAVILMIGDGMGFSQITLARDLELPVGERFAFESLPVTGLVSTRSASNMVTDSGAAATAMASGVKTTNQVVGMDPEEHALTTIADRAQEHGWKIGYVTTTSLTHATPAAFYASVPDRYLYTDDIGAQLLEQAPDVALAGGRSDFLPQAEQGDRLDGRNLLEEAEAAGYTVWGYDADLSAEPPDKLLGLFAGSHLYYELDKPRLPETVRTPQLSELTRVALSALDGSSFFLMIEGGRIDHAAHGFDAAGVGAELAAFDEAVKVVLDYQRAHPDVLVLLTADHATGGLAVNDYVDWEALHRQRSSLEWIINHIRDEDEPAGVDFLNEMTGYDDFTEADVAKLHDEGDKYTAGRNLGTMLGERNGVTWIPRIDEWETKGHTGEDVPLYAGGPGAERFQGVLDNTDIPHRLCELLGWPQPGIAADGGQPEPAAAP